MKNADQPAFPTVEEIYTLNVHKEKEIQSMVTNHGLTKREYLAAMAMQGLCAACDGNVQGMEPNDPNIQFFAKMSVFAADELLKQLES